MVTDESRKNAAAEFVAALDEFLVQEAAAGHTLEESLAKAHHVLRVTHNRLIAAERRASFKVVPKP
jgi:hypothetical protein